MSGWTEESIRKAAAWQAFKEGKSLFESGQVASVEAGSTGWQGTVRSGSRLLKVRVIAKSPTNIEAHCPCSDNQRTGAVCAHAVATGLASVSPKRPAPAPVPAPARADAASPSTSPPKSHQAPAWAAAPPPPAAVAWQILLPLNWRDALKRGKLAATLATSPDEEISPADDRLTAWLAREKVARKSIITLNIDSTRVPALLEAIADHPRLAVGKDRVLIQIRAGERLRIASADLEGDLVHLVPDTGSGPWIEIGGSFWHIGEETVTRIGEGTTPAALAKSLGRLSQGQSEEIPTRSFFNQLESWQEWITFPEGSWLDALHFVPAAANIGLHLEGSLQHLEGQLLVSYGSSPPVPPGLGKVDGLPRLAGDRCEVRDLTGEERAVNKLSKAGFQPEDFSSGRWVLKGESAVLAFLTQTLPVLRQQWSVTEGERFGHVQKQVTVVSPKIDIIGSGTDWLSFDLSFQTSDGESIPAAEVRRLLRSGSTSGKVAGGKHLVISNEVAGVIDPLFSGMDLRQEGGHFVASALAGELVREIHQKIYKSQKTNESASLLTFEKPTSLIAELRPYQEHGSRWMFDRVERFGGALLADDMGLGKTVQTIALVERLFGQSSKNSMSMNSTSNNSISRDLVSKNSVLKNSISKNSVSKNSVSRDSVSKNSVSRDSGAANSGWADSGAGLGMADFGVADSGVANSGVADLGGADSGVADSGVAKSGVADFGGANSGGADFGGADSRVADLGVADSGVANSGVAGLGVAKSGVADSGGAKSGGGNSGGGNSGGADLGVEDSGVVMVVATASLLGNWKAEFGRFAPGRVVRILHGAGRDAERERVRAGDVILTSYGTLARDLAWHLKREYRAVVVDEASLMRNPDTDHAKAIAKLKASRRIALTGTPIENGVKDLWSIFRFIQPGWLGDRAEFKDRYEAPLLLPEMAGGVLERLRLKTSPFLLRRTKEQVAPELPSKLFIDEFCDLSPDQQAVYKELLVEGRKRVDAFSDAKNKGAARMQMLTALLRLRQTCCDLALLKNERFNQLLVARRSAKLERLLELIEEAVNGNHRMLIFSQFQTQLQEIEKCVSGRGWESLRLDGQTRNRQQLVDKFQQADGPPVFLISLKAGGYGLNLTAADTVVHFDPWWNPAAEAQATDRAHRIGQTRPMTVYRLLTRGTVEEKVVRLQSKKRELASAIDDESGTGDAAGWSMEELESILA